VVKISKEEYPLETRCGVSTTPEDFLNNITSTDDLRRLIERMINETSIDMSNRRAATIGVCAGQLVLDLRKQEQPQTPHHSSSQ
jgi:poly(3-hydroxybutyrate) depolymerase